ncbi:MAG: 2-oxoglutarate dehydrogenase complex dihydrolipoyllysine-residue succinyltransferase [Saprospiraceae bacterium]
MSIVDIKVPPMGESITEVTLAKWLKKEGDFINMDEPICEFESDKATLDLPAEASGQLQIIAKAGSDLKIGEVIARINKDVSAPVTAEAPIEAKTSTQTSPTVPITAKDVSASPAAAKILREASIAPADISGTGKEGRITKEDAVKASEKTPSSIPTSVASAPLVQTAHFSRAENREKMTRMRRTISKRLVSAKNETAMLTTFNEVDMTEILALRTKYQDQFVAKYGIKLGFMSLFAKACSKVLMEMKEVNAFIDGEELIYHDYADISIAISTPNGLVVPPVKNVESLKFHEIEYKIKDLAEKARAGKLTLEEMSGGTFTITNGGIFGSMMSTPILNEPQSAILGMHAIIERPVAILGEIKIRPMMYLALSYDHRVIDGSSSVTFLVKVKKLLEDPMTLMLEI